MFPKDLRNKLAELRITSLIGTINLENIEAVREDLLRFALSSSQPAKLLIDSSGGFLAEGLFLFDFIKTIDIPVIGIVNGRCMSIAVNILQACSKRFATSHSWFMIHAISSGKKYVFDNDYDREIEDQERILNIMYEQVLDILTKKTCKTREEIDGLLRKGDKYGRKLCAIDALNMGLLDRILSENEAKLFQYVNRNISVLESVEIV